MELREGDYYEIEQWLLSGEVEAGFLNGQKSEQYQFTELQQDPLLCIVSDKSPLFDKTEIDIVDLEDMPFIMTSYKGTNDVKVLLEQYHVKPNIRFELRGGRDSFHDFSSFRDQYFTSVGYSKFTANIESDSVKARWLPNDWYCHETPCFARHKEICRDIKCLAKRTKQLPKIVAIEAYPYITLK